MEISGLSCMLHWFLMSMSCARDKPSRTYHQ
jgi:hypothetical protein